MIYKVFMLHDAKAEFWMCPPLCYPTVPQVVRVMMQEFARPDTMLSHHPADFALYQVASFDDATGQIVPLDRYEFIGTGVSFLPKVPAQGELV